MDFLAFEDLLCRVEARSIKPAYIKIPRVRHFVGVTYDVNNDVAPEAWLTLDSCYLIGWNQKNHGDNGDDHDEWDRCITDSKSLSVFACKVQGEPAKVKPTNITLFYPSKCTNALLFNSAIL